MMDKQELLLKLIERLMLDDTPTQGSITKSEPIGADIIGKYVICRSRNEGINAGYVEALDDTGVVLTAVRRIWYHKPKAVNTSWYEGVAESGLSNDSKVSSTVSKKVIIEDYSLTLCKEDARISIMEKLPNGQN